MLILCSALQPDWTHDKDMKKIPTRRRSPRTDARSVEIPWRVSTHRLIPLRVYAQWRKSRCLPYTFTQHSAQPCPFALGARVSFTLTPPLASSADTSVLGQIRIAPICVLRIRSSYSRTDTIFKSILMPDPQFEEGSDEEGRVRSPWELLRKYQRIYRQLRHAPDGLPCRCTVPAIQPCGITATRSCPPACAGQAPRHADSWRCPPASPIKSVHVLLAASGRERSQIRSPTALECRLNE